MKRIVWLMKNLYTGLGIKYKLFIALSMIMVVYFLITIITQQVSFHIYDEQIYRKSSQVLNLSSSSIEYELKKMENLSFNIMADKQIQAYLKTLRREMTVYEKNELRKNLEDKLLSYYTGSEPYIHSIQMIAAGGEEFTGRYPDFDDFSREKGADFE